MRNNGPLRKAVLSGQLATIAGPDWNTVLAFVASYETLPIFQ